MKIAMRAISAAAGLLDLNRSCAKRPCCSTAAILSRREHPIWSRVAARNRSLPEFCEQETDHEDDYGHRICPCHVGGVAGLCPVLSGQLVGRLQFLCPGDSEPHAASASQTRTPHFAATVL